MRSTGRALLLAALGGAAAACTTVGPEYQEPDVSWLTDWQSDLYGQLADPPAQTATDLGFWWYLFDDPGLNALIEAARQDSPTLHIAGLRVLESRAVLGIAGSGRFPQLQQLSSAASYVNSDKQGGIAADRRQTLTSYQADFTVGWELDFWGRFRRAIESADAAFAASITAQQDLQVLVSAQVADLYFAYRTTQQRIEIARKNGALQQRSFEITSMLFKAGQGSELDLQQARAQYLSTLASIPELETVLVQLRNAIAAVLGRPPGPLPELVAGASALPEVDPLTVQVIPAQLVLRRPDVRGAAWQVAAQSAQIGIARADYFPAISLFGSLGWSGDSLSATPDTTRLVAGPSVTWNVFDWGRIRNNVRVQDARLEQTIESFENSVLQAAREIDDAAIAVVKTAEQQRFLDEALSAAERSLTLANTRYQEGYADFQRVLDAQRVLFSQAERQLVNHGAQLSAIVELYKALGGGWLATPVESMIPEPVRQRMEERTDWGDLLQTPLPADAAP